MDLANSALEILNQLADVVREIRDEDFVRPSEVLHGATLGQHVRHTLEFFICLQEGCKTRSVNYDLRAHDQRMQEDKNVALAAIDDTVYFVKGMQGSQPLTLCSYHGDALVSISTNSSRELIYNIEHAVHHMAMIKIAMSEICPYISLNPQFGVSASTLRYRDARRLMSQS